MSNDSSCHKKCDIIYLKIKKITFTLSIIQHISKNKNTEVQLMYNCDIKTSNHEFSSPNYVIFFKDLTAICNNHHIISHIRRSS